MTAINLALASLKATGATTGRTFGDRFSDWVNVKDYGAVGDGATNDATAIQAAFDAAFGTSGSPHGSASAYSNRTVFFPVGSYIVGSTLNLTKVVGGRIIGSGVLGTKLTYSGSVAGGGTITALIRSNGLANCSLENMNLSISGTNTCCFDLDWDNTSGGDGLHNNLFLGILLESATNGIIIANSGNGGTCNTFVDVSVNTSTSSGAGIDARGSAALGNCVIGGGGLANVCYKCSGGALSSINGANLESSDYGVDITANVQVCFNGGRSEHANNFRISSGQLTVHGFLHAVAGNFANITGGKVIIDACDFNVSNGGSSVIIGNAGSLYLRGNNANAGFHSGYSGTVVQEI